MCVKKSIIILSECSMLGRKVQRPIPLHRPIGFWWLYIYITNQHMQEHFSICQWCPPSLVTRLLFSRL